MVTGGLTVLNPKLTDTGIAATNNKDFVGIPDYKSNILAEYHVPKADRRVPEFRLATCRTPADRRH